MPTWLTSLIAWLLGCKWLRRKPALPSGSLGLSPVLSVLSAPPSSASSLATPAPSIPEAVLAVAKSQLGVQEHPRGSNSGPEVDRYLDFVHTRPGEPWCAAAVSWCCNRGGATQLRYSASAMRLLTL